LQEDWQTLFLYQTKLEQLQQKWVVVEVVVAVAAVVMVVVVLPPVQKLLVG
jgi:hypothetical protein